MRDAHLVKEAGDRPLTGSAVIQLGTVGEGPIGTVDSANQEDFTVLKQRRRVIYAGTVERSSDAPRTGFRIIQLSVPANFAKDVKAPRNQNLAVGQESGSVKKPS